MFYEFTKGFKVFESFGSIFPITSILTIDLAFLPISLHGL